VNRPAAAAPSIAPSVWLASGELGEVGEIGVGRETPLPSGVDLKKRR
jgi:hypothetical protein